MADIKIRVSPQTVKGFQRDGRTVDDLVAIAERDFARAAAAHAAAWEEVNALRAKVKELSDALRGAEAYASVVMITAASIMSMKEVITFAEADLEVAQEAFNFASAAATQAEAKLLGAKAFAKAIDLFAGSVETHTVEEAPIPWGEHPSDW